MSISIEDIVQALRRYRHATDKHLQDARQKAGWVWEALQGDFNPRRSAGQIGFDTAVCLIPGVDTLMDVRDLIANIIAIARAPASGVAWFNLLLTLVGFIPELGSVAKGVVKIVFVKLRPLIRQVDELKDGSKMVKYLNEAFDAALPEIVQYLRHPKVQQFLTRAGVPDVVKWVGDSIRTVASRIDGNTLEALLTRSGNELKVLLERLGPRLPEAATAQIKAVTDGIALVQNRFRESVDAYIVPLRLMMFRLAERLDELHWVAHTQQLNKGWIAPLSEQGARRLIQQHKPRWVKTAGRPKFGQLNPGRFRLDPEYKAGLAMRARELDDTTIKSFAKGVKARPLRDGETLYRVIDPTSGSLSTCWIPESVWKEINANPELAREVWRGKLAVLPEWNQNGSYVKYTYNKARDGKIVVWEGPTAVQYFDTQSQNLAEGYLEGGLTQIVWSPMKKDRSTNELIPDQLLNAKGDDFVKAQFPDMVEGGIIKDAAGEARKSGVRTRINDPRIDGPFETGWGFKDFEDQHALIGLPNPMKE